MVPDDPDEPDPGTNVAMRAVRHASQAEPDPAKSGSVDVQFSSNEVPVVKRDPQPRRPRGKTFPGMIAESLTHHE